MDKENLNTLWKEYVDKADIDEMQKNNLEILGTDLRDDIDFLYKLIKFFKGNYEDRIESRLTGITFECDESLYILRKGNIGIFLPEDKMKKTVINMIDLFEDILPLGSVVDLKQENIKKYFSLSGVENLRVVITKRFIGIGNSIFYPYAGTLYPLGSFGDGKMMFFTSSMIWKVVHRGFCDQIEEQFAVMMKQELIVKMGKKTAGFCSEAELQEVRRKMEVSKRNGRTQ